MITLTTPRRIAPENQGVRMVPGSTYFDSKVEWVAEGLSVTHQSYTDKDGVTHLYDDVKHEAEYAPVRSYSFTDLRAGIVADINGQKYRIRISVNDMDEDDSWGDCGTPEHATVTFEPVHERTMETLWTPWDEEATKANIRRCNDEAIAKWRAKNDGDTEEMVGYLEEQNAKLVDQKLTPKGDVHLFGLPYFIQNPIFPALNGKAAQCLAVLETEWGDSGNINLLFACDEAGVPCNVWFEASCC